jgi:hypothetical protein
VIEQVLEVLVHLGILLSLYALRVNIIQQFYTVNSPYGDWRVEGSCFSLNRLQDELPAFLACLQSSNLATSDSSLTTKRSSHHCNLLHIRKVPERDPSSFLYTETDVQKAWFGELSLRIKSAPSDSKRIKRDDFIRRMRVIIVLNQNFLKNTLFIQTFVQNLCFLPFSSHTPNICFYLGASNDFFWV